MVSPVTATLGKFAVELPISLLVLNALSVRIMSATLTDYVCFIIFCCFDVCGVVGVCGMVRVGDVVDVSLAVGNSNVLHTQ